MSQLTAILKYQEVDKKLYALERELASSEERKEYVKARKFMESAPERLEALDTKAVSLKARAAELMQKYAQAEETLADFEHLDELVEEGADISFYKKKAQVLMDKMRKIKQDLVALIEEINATDVEYKKLKKQVIAMQEQYKEAKKKYEEIKGAREEERAAIEGELKTIAKDIPPEWLEKYKMKRKEKVFPVYVCVQASRCSYCGVELPVVAVNKLKGDLTIECDNCHRIIYNG